MTRNGKQNLAYTFHQLFTIKKREDAKPQRNHCTLSYLRRKTVGLLEAVFECKEKHLNYSFNSKLSVYENYFLKIDEDKSFLAFVGLLEPDFEWKEQHLN